MIIPVRCFSCGRVVGSVYSEFIRLTTPERPNEKAQMGPAEALSHLGLKRYCCRRMILSQVDLIDEVMPFG
jgi:DNA-directed RNA polymerase subunit N (RpoN/RPB10)